MHMKLEKDIIRFKSSPSLHQWCLDKPAKPTLEKSLVIDESMPNWIANSRTQQYDECFTVDHCTVVMFVVFELAVLIFFYKYIQFE